ncbi:MAG TPA: hypothetical protein VFN13_14160 [Rudaea sp.]|nr:hypothetical protein [Rudaea sp.]
MSLGAVRFERRRGAPKSTDCQRFSTSPAARAPPVRIVVEGLNVNGLNAVLDEK